MWELRPEVDNCQQVCLQVEEAFKFRGVRKDFNRSSLRSFIRLANLYAYNLPPQAVNT